MLATLITLTILFPAGEPALPAAALVGQYDGLRNEGGGAHVVRVWDEDGVLQTAWLNPDNGALIWRGTLKLTRTSDGWEYVETYGPPGAWCSPWHWRICCIRPVGFERGGWLLQRQAR